MKPNKKGSRNHPTPQTDLTGTPARHKDKDIILSYIIKQVEIGTGLPLPKLKRKFSEDRLFSIGLRYVTTTKKAFCTALNIPIEGGCRYKRKLEKEGRLKQSIDKVICPLTKHRAHIISTNPKEFERLQKSKTNQLRLFE